MYPPELEPEETPTPATKEAQDKLIELTNQSWNLELVISGAALFATLSLPEFLDSVLVYYRYNLMTDTDYIHDGVPSQVMGLIKGVSYSLFGAFLAHFIMRAFWVGLLGLLAVYPDGIRYDHIYNLSQYAREKLAKEMGPLPDYIIRLDKRCNVIFALAFSMALFLLGIAIVYGLFLLTETALQLLIPEHLYKPVREVVSWVFAIGFIGIGITVSVLNRPKFRDNPRFAPIVFQLNQVFSVLFMGLYKPLLYIVYTFYSQIPQPVLKRRLVWSFGIFMLAELLFISVQLLKTEGATELLDSRSYITLRAPNQKVDANSFDNLRTPDELIDQASIQSDVIREPYVRLFMSYPKSLDVELAKRFREPKWPDSLSRKVRREKRAIWYLKSFETYFGVYLNDSLYRSPDFLFTKRADNGQQGLTTVLLTANLKPGRNTLKVMVPDSANKPTAYCQIPFWYVPEN
ncbi:hypothetical protein [Spirosoma foliorum]|uniref:Uncharacterized protein n=1 Tax=Spirosoma foliorum TaxID=2710596 RepID=A0A7G5H071_9BACT|nr:hypothetical protein [Spirosoma foliorum]QMW04513.1 hypothetical protein H3H32_06110 [Spirosoma foliorum]